MPFQIFFWDCCLEKLFFGPVFENSFSMGQNSKEKAFPKHGPAKNPANQKVQPKSQAKSFKTSIQISKQQPKNGAAREARRPVFGRRRLRRRVVVLKFVSIFCRTWLGFLAELFCWLDSLLAYALGWLFPWSFGPSKKLFSKSGQEKTVFPNSGPTKKKHFF